MKNPFKFKTKQLVPTVALPSQPQEPRSLEEINKVYAELCARAGQLQYKILIDKEQLSQLNAAIKSVNQEADARQKLNAEEVKKEQPEVKNG